ncbi:MAG: heparinase II/III family protein, partial [Acidobacteria bacterium]|nr:heparinase II/III family protein [Acidobacteriota bacterium]
VIGTAGRWILADPGYQQYMDGEEREFTLGPTAHNYPVINGQRQTTRRPHLLSLDSPHTVVDLSDCYPQALAGYIVKRHLWLHENRFVVVADELKTTVPASVKYHWHGHPDTSWWAEGGQLLLSLDNSDLWLSSPHLPLDLGAVARLPGSRGQLTAIATIHPAPPVIWWVFALGARPQAAALDISGRAITLSGRTFTL